MALATLTSTAMAETATVVADANESSTTADYDTFGRYRVGGYGEAVAKFMNYGINRFYGGTDNSDDRSTISIPRFVVAFDYKFNSKWILGAEIEFEAGGVGTETELENSENGEYETEMEKGGEVALEQFHITRLIHRSFNVRGGHMIVPIGLTNAHHEPINFFGTSRPEGETTIIPSTWHETGLSFFGDFGRGHSHFSYEAMVVTGLNPDGFGRDGWVSGGKQGLFEEDNFSQPAYVGRLEWKGVPGLRLSGSIYYCPDVTQNADKTYKYSSVGSSAVTIWSLDGQYRDRFVTARANIISGNLENSSAISSVTLSNKSSYYSGAMRQTAKRALTWGAEAGVNLKNIVGRQKFPVVYPFVRYEYYNPQEKAESLSTVDERCQVSKWTFGANWYALPNLVVKADWTTRQIGTSKIFGTSQYHAENEFAIGVAYTAWFMGK